MTDRRTDKQIDRNKVVIYDNNIINANWSRNNSPLGLCVWPEKYKTTYEDYGHCIDLCL